MPVEYIYLTRHAESFTNWAGRADIRNPKITPKGVESVEAKREKMMTGMTNTPTVILCSPLKRCLETCLLSYEMCDECPKIYVMSILMEHNLEAENDGDEVEVIKTDPDLTKYKHFDKLNFNFMMYGNDCAVWHDPKFRKNRLQRIESLWDFLSKVGNIKSAHIFTHCGFIDRFLQRNIDNFATWEVPIEEGRPLGSWRTWRQIV
jgi:broad specificity phosphatase PhoE